MEAQNIYMTRTRTELSRALDSRAIHTTAYLRADAKAPLLVYVEDSLDIPFWRNMFQCISGRYSELNITTLKERAVSGNIEINCVGKTLSATGKDVLMQVQGLGPNKVVAVDRDFDGLIDNYHGYTKKMRNNKYIISTTYYSIENHLVFPEAVNSYICKITSEEQDRTLEYQSILTKYNDLLDPILPLQLVCAEEHVICGGRMPYEQKSLSEDVSCTNNKHDDATFQKCRKAIISKRGSLFAAKTTEIERMKTRLTKCSKYPNALWKVMRGHILYAFVYGYMRRIIQSVYDIRESAIYTKCGYGKEAEVKIKKLQEQMFAPYADLRTCAYYYAYDNPEIDYSDEGIVKIINKIKNIS